MQMASRKAVPPPGATSIIVARYAPDLPPLRSATVDEAGAGAIRFSVRYRLWEYLAFLHEHVLRQSKSAGRFNPRRHLTISLALAGVLVLLAAAGYALAAHRLLLGSAAGAALALLYAVCNTGLGIKFQIAAFGIPLFLYKRQRMPECRFTIDTAGIERVTALGTMVLGWDEIVAVRTYSRGYVLLMQRGGLPIPLRCLSAAQTTRLRALVAAHRVR